MTVFGKFKGKTAACCYDLFLYLHGMTLGLPRLVNRDDKHSSSTYTLFPQWAMDFVHEIIHKW